MPERGTKKFHEVSSSPSLVSLHSSPQKLVERSTIEIYGHRYVPANIRTIDLNSEGVSAPRYSRNFIDFLDVSDSPGNGNISKPRMHDDGSRFTKEVRSSFY